MQSIIALQDRIIYSRYYIVTAEIARSEGDFPDAINKFKEAQDAQRKNKELEDGTDISLALTYIDQAYIANENQKIDDKRESVKAAEKILKLIEKENDEGNYQPISKLWAKYGRIRLLALKRGEQNRALSKARELKESLQTPQPPPPGQKFVIYLKKHNLLDELTNLITILSK